jgi:hypothetical protein
MRNNLSDRIRDYVRREYIEPARRRREVAVRIVAGDVHRALHLTNRVPVVCSALSSKGFLKENRLEMNREGPPSGLSTTVVFTYRFANEDSGKSPKPSRSPFYSFRGIAKDVFQALGGGEAFIRSEREQFHGIEPEDHQSE